MWEFFQSTDYILFYKSLFLSVETDKRSAYTW